MALKGNLRDFSLHQLLNLINLAHKTGALTVKPEKAANSSNGHSAPAALFFREGRLIHAFYEGKPARLTDVLVQVGRLTPEQAQAVRQRSRIDTDKELGLLLIHNGLLSQNDIIQGVRGYLLETVYQLFTWTAGDFRFEPNELPPDERITVPLSLENVILEGNRRQQEWEKLNDAIPDLDVSLRFAERPSQIRNISLTREEWQVISFINARNTIRQIGEYLMLDEFQVRRVVYGLKQNGLVELMQPPRPEPAVPKAPLPGVKLSRGVLLRIIDGIRRR